MFPELSGITTILPFGGKGLPNDEHYKSNFHASLKKISEGEYVQIFFFLCDTVSKIC